MTLTIRERFEAKISYEPMSGCWLWTGYRDKDGYGQIARGGKHGGMMLAHRASWSMSNGTIPEDKEIDHICCNPSCVNPEHLRLATSSQNKMNKGVRGDSSCGMKGVTWHKQNQRWRARIKVNGVQISLGCFSRKDEAYAAYCKAAVRLHNEFANTGSAI